MDFKVGVFADGQLSGEAVNAAKNALQEVALKYKCRFELMKGVIDQEQDAPVDANSKPQFKAKFNDRAKSNNGDVFLSFGGEIEI